MDDESTWVFVEPDPVETIRQEVKAMTPDTKELVERARKFDEPHSRSASYTRRSVPTILRDLMRELADALEAQQAEIARLQDVNLHMSATTISTEVAEYRAEAIERALLDRLMEPSEGMYEAAHDRLAGEGDVNDLFRAMLTQFRKDNGYE